MTLTADEIAWLQRNKALSGSSGGAPPAGAGAAKGSGVAGLKLADLSSNFDAADKACGEIDQLIAAHPNDPGVARMRKDLDAKFQMIIRAGEDSYRSLDQIFAEVKPDEKQAQHIRDEYGEAIKHFGNAVRLTGTAQYRAANAELHLGHTGVRIAAIDLDGLIKDQVRSADLMITALGLVQNGCLFLLSVLSGGAEGAAVKYGVALIGAATKGAQKWSAEQLFHMESDITLGDIAATALIDLVGLKLQKGLGLEDLEKDLEPFLDTELKNCTVVVKEYVKGQVKSNLIALIKTSLHKVADAFCKENATEKKPPMEFVLDVLKEAAADYAKDGLAETVGTFIKAKSGG